MEQVHLCLSDLIDQDSSAYEFYHALSGKVQAKLADREITTLDELQAAVNRINASIPHQ